MFITDKIKDIYWSIIPYEYHPKEIIYKIKCFCWKRYKIVNPRYLPYTYVDSSTKLPHAMFEILSKFIEEECSPEVVEWYGHHSCKTLMNGRMRYNRDIMQELYTWWHEIYNKYYKQVDDDLYKLFNTHSPDWDECWFPVPDDKVVLDVNRAYENHDTLTQKDKIVRYKALKAMNSLEVFMLEELEDKMCMLCRISDSLWT